MKIILILLILLLASIIVNVITFLSLKKLRLKLHSEEQKSYNLSVAVSKFKQNTLNLVDYIDKKADIDKGQKDVIKKIKGATLDEQEQVINSLLDSIYSK